MPNVFLEITLALILAGTIAYLVNLFKQPTIIAYILTGLVLGPIGLSKIESHGVVEGLSQIGITLLLFTVGLELDIKQLKLLGRPIILAGTVQVIVTTLLGFFISLLLGFGTIPALYLGVALTFSSTVIVLKLLNEKKETQSLYGKIAIGIFLLQDLFAIVLLVFLTGFNQTSSNWSLQIAAIIAKLALLIAIVVIHSKYIFPRVLKQFTKSDELLLIFSLAWALGFSSLVSMPFFGFNLAIGGFLAGLSLASAAQHLEISAKVAPLRDFFIMLFFVVLGSSIDFSSATGILIPIIVFSAFVILINPAIVIITLSYLGFKPRTSFMTGITIGQISEFSLIVTSLGVSKGLIGGKESIIVVLVGIITISVSSYLILHSHTIFNIIKPYLRWLDKGSHDIENIVKDTKLKNHIVLIGAHRLGEHIVESLVKLKTQFIVIDYNPHIVHSLRQRGVTAICGDITDTHIQEAVSLDTAKLVISTLPSIKDTLTLSQAILKNSKKPNLIVTAQDEAEAEMLYLKNADYVVMPYFLGANHLKNILDQLYNKKVVLKSLKQQHLKSLTLLSKRQFKS